MKHSSWGSISSDATPSDRELSLYSKITRQSHFGGENQFKSQSENPPKQPWRGKWSADITIFPAKTILAGYFAHNHELEIQAIQSYEQT
jgi:hypothetical protein